MSFPVSDENVQVFTYLEEFTQLGSVIHSSTSCEEEVKSATRTSLKRDEFAGRRCVALPILVQKEKIRVFHSLVLLLF